ncbi:metalloprotease TldD [Pararobbsia silviterrae]|uniref:Metalloprotease TldD n=1 Tax=Pararobbsia silviterrae TaxID=1792498 RepID=A0A494Y5R3_9BURK|nr:metalloprotease TldD [Pararobbsia silviterrae]RKP57613.1 metalloprotease TldD [Pararobbsia silviterrae]
MTIDEPSIACPVGCDETADRVAPTGVDNLTLAKAALLEPYGLDEGVLQNTLGDMYATRIDDADLFFELTHTESWMLEDGIVKAGSRSIDRGVGVRAMAGERTALAHSAHLSASALRRAAHTVREIGRGATSGGTDIVIPLDLSHGFKRSATHALYTQTDPLASLEADEKTARLHQIEALARSRDARVKKVTARLSSQHQIVLIARADGTLAADVRPLVHLSIQILVEHRGRREMGASSGGGRYDGRRFDTAFIARHVDAALHRAFVNLEAQSAPAGTMSVVLGPGWPGVMLHEAIGHGLEGDAIRKRTSVFSGRLGERVAAPGVTIVDDGTLRARRGSLNIDDEGHPTQCTTLIEDGILRGYLHDTLNARLMGVPTTGNGRRQSYASLPLPRMTNTYMRNGDKDPREIIESVKSGIYAVNFGGGQVDIVTGKFVFGATEAYRIENGRLTHPIKGATLIGSGPESLQYVSLIGNDMRLDDGGATCGKNGQSVPVGVGQPTLRIDEMTVGGTVS